MEKQCFFTQVSGFNQVSPFVPTPETEWDNINPATKKNGQFIWAQTIEELRFKYAEAIGYHLRPEVDNWYIRWYSPTGEPVGNHFPNNENDFYANQELKKIIL